MATPEISHRCALCGAAIRPGAASCPNCGEGEARPAPVLAQTQAAVPPEPMVASSWMMQPDLEIDGAATLPAEEPFSAGNVAPPVYRPTLAEPETLLEIPAAPPELLAESVPEAEAAALAEPPELLIEEAAPVLADTQSLTPAEKLALIKTSDPQVKVLDGPYRPRKRRRRSQSATLKERLAGRVDQLRDASFGASRKVAPAVDQLRHTSNAVLDRASDDPSARFLLIGTLLVGVAAFVFFVSFFMG